MLVESYVFVSQSVNKGPMIRYGKRYIRRTINQVLDNRLEDMTIPIRTLTLCEYSNAFNYIFLITNLFETPDRS